MATKKSKINIVEALQEMGKETGINEDVIITCLREAVIATVNKKLENDCKIYKTSTKIKQEKVKLNDALLECDIDLKKGKINLERKFLVVSEDDIQDDFIEISLEDAKERFNKNAKIGDYVSENIDVSTFSPAEILKIVSNFKQRTKKAQTVALLEIYKDKIGQIISGEVVKCDQSGVAVKIGKTEVTLYKNDLIGDETYKPGEQIKVYVTGISTEGKKNSSLIKCSRSVPGFLQKLFENEISDIYNGTVLIKDIARIPGVRSKVAVYSNNPNVDPSGACIGEKGTRIQNIVSLLGNSKEKEKIDVIAYNENKGLYLSEILKPAVVLGANFVLENGDNLVEVIVNDGDSSLAIGNKGCNVKLAKKLLKVDKLVIKELSEALAENLTYKTMEEFKVEAIEEERRRFREKSLEIANENKTEYLNLEGTSENVNFFDKDENIDETIEEEVTNITLPVEETVEENVTNETVTETNVTEPEIVEPKVEVKVTPKEEIREVKTTTTLEDLEKQLEEEKANNANKKPFKKKNYKEEKVEKENITITKVTKGMDIYTEEELRALDEEEELEFDDYYEDDYSEYDDDSLYED